MQIDDSLPFRVVLPDRSQFAPSDRFEEGPSFIFSELGLSQEELRHTHTGTVSPVAVIDSLIRKGPKVGKIEVALSESWILITATDACRAFTYRAANELCTLPYNVKNVFIKDDMRLATEMILFLVHQLLHNRTVRKNREVELKAYAQQWDYERHAEVLKNENGCQKVNLYLSGFVLNTAVLYRLVQLVEAKYVAEICIADFSRYITQGPSWTLLHTVCHSENVRLRVSTEEAWIDINDEMPHTIDFRSESGGIFDGRGCSHVTLDVKGKASTFISLHTTGLEFSRSSIDKETKEVICLTGEFNSFTLLTDSVLINTNLADFILAVVKGRPNDLPLITIRVRQPTRHLRCDFAMVPNVVRGLIVAMSKMISRPRPLIAYADLNEYIKSQRYLVPQIFAYCPPDGHEKEYETWQNIMNTDNPVFLLCSLYPLISAGLHPDSMLYVPFSAFHFWLKERLALEEYIILVMLRCLVFIEAPEGGERLEPNLICETICQFVGFELVYPPVFGMHDLRMGMEPLGPSQILCFIPGLPSFSQKQRDRGADWFDIEEPSEDEDGDGEYNNKRPGDTAWEKFRNSKHKNRARTTKKRKIST